MNYEIRKGKNAPCQLVSIVTRKEDCNLPGGVWHEAGHTYENFVCEGTWIYCASIKTQLMRLGAKVAAAVESEREACAAIADGLLSEDGAGEPYFDSGWNCASAKAAKLIRARGEGHD